MGKEEALGVALPGLLSVLPLGPRALGRKSALGEEDVWQAVVFMRDRKLNH